MFIFVFDPLAVLLLIAANFSFINRNNHDTRQEEIFDAIFSKKKEDDKEKTLDKKPEINDNVNNDVEENDTSIEDMIKNASPEALKIVEQELEREINTRKEKSNGWLDDLNK